MDTPIRVSQEFYNSLWFAINTWTPTFYWMLGTKGQSCVLFWVPLKVSLFRSPPQPGQLWHMLSSKTKAAYQVLDFLPKRGCKEGPAAVCSLKHGFGWQTSPFEQHERCWQGQAEWPLGSLKPIALVTVQFPHTTGCENLTPPYQLTCLHLQPLVGQNAVHFL